MWRDIALANRPALSRVLAVFIEGLEEFRHTLDAGDSAGLLEYFGLAKALDFIGSSIDADNIAFSRAWAQV